MIRVLLADDQMLIRAAVRELIAHEPDLEVVGEAADGDTAVRLTTLHRPDVVLMDIRMPGSDGIAATARICDDPGLGAVRVLILTTFEDDENVVRALRAGASGFVGKGTDPADLMRAIRTVHAGESLLSPGATRGLIRRFVQPRSSAGRPRPTTLPLLTERETETLVLVGRGLSNDEIGDRLSIAPATVKTHVNRAMGKLGVHDRAQLVIIAYETGLLVPGET